MDNENISKSYKFLIEKPSQKDLFDSGSHSRTASAVYHSLDDDNDINVVGVEGNLGSGKSTVLELIKKMSEGEQYEFVEFDVEKFQHGATKKALIEKLHLAIDNCIVKKEGKDKINKAKNVALGNHFEYTSNVKSNINIWIVWFTISLLVGMRLLPDALTGVGNFFLFLFHCMANDFNTAKDQFSFSGLSFLSIILVWFPWHIVRCAQKRKKILWFLGTPPTTGDIFKRNSNDKISETIEINKEVGAYELQQALESFVSEIPEDKRLILVLDNLDRVTDEKLREVWSDIEVFTSIAQAKIQLLIPYSIKHVASSLSSDESEGVEFISKRIPISFRVAPILSADWKSSCSDMIKETGINAEDHELKGILSLIDLWTYAYNIQVTPRFMKKLVNSIVSILSTHSETISPVTAFYYQLAVQSCRVSSTEVLSSESEDKNVNLKLVESKKIIERVLDFEEWSKELVSIHYLSNYNVAESEILTSPLKRALENSDIDPFISKQNIYAYDRILLDLIDDEGTDKFISLLLLMSESENEKAKPWLEKWYPSVNTAIDSDYSKIEDIESLVSSTSNLIESGIEINTGRIDSHFDSINDVPSTILKSDDVQSTLEVLYSTGQLLDVLPSAMNVFNAKMFYNHLWPNKDKFTYWNINTNNLTEDNLQDLFKIICEAGTIEESLLEAISTMYRIGWLVDEDRLKSIFSTMVTPITINDGTGILESNIYSESWYSANQYNYYQSNFSAIDDEHKTKWVAQAIASMVYHNTPQYLNHFKAHIVINDEFNQELANCLAVTSDFKQLLSALENPELNEYVSNAINILVVERRIFRLGIDVAISKYETFRGINSDSDEIINFLAVWQRHFKFSIKKLENINTAFLKDVLNSKNSNTWSDKFVSIIDNGGDASVDWWTEQIETPNAAISLVVNDWYVNNKKSFQKCASLTDALKQFFSNLSPKKLEGYSNKNWISSLIVILPKASISALSRVLNKLIGMPSTSFKESQCIVINCDKYVEIPSSMSNESILALFENIISDQQIASWFDLQKLDFESWDNDVLNSFVASLVELEEDDLIFENINSSRVIKEVKKSRLASSIEDLTDETL